MKQTMRWFGPQDSVSLEDIRQAGCSGVVTALHEIPVGDVWQESKIAERKLMIKQAGLDWHVVESLPVHEHIKTGAGDRDVLIDQYIQSLINLANQGIEVVTYNFMPLLDWLRTDLSFKLDDGSIALRFDRLAYVAFDLFLLERPGAEKDYTALEIAAARDYFCGLSELQKQTLVNTTLLGLPGSDEPFTKEGILSALNTYSHIDRSSLKNNLRYFLQRIVPVASEYGIRLAIHPDDPPYPVIGLPRVVSTAEDITDLLAFAPSPANGICFCTGSLSARPDNDLSAILRKNIGNIHFLHLRNTHRDESGNFWEAGHLNGSVNMFALMQIIVEHEQAAGIELPMRPDHGHQLSVDAHRKTYPGYSLVGRLKGLAELRGLEMGIKMSITVDSNTL